MPSKVNNIPCRLVGGLVLLLVQLMTKKSCCTGVEESSAIQNKKKKKTKEEYIATLVELEYPAYVDNFDLSDGDTFSLRVLVQEETTTGRNDSSNGGGGGGGGGGGSGGGGSIYDDGPLVVYTGNEGNIEGFANSTGQVYLLAEELGGRAAFVEQRFYGKSTIPGADGNNEYALLSTEQVLADLVGAISYLKGRYHPHNQQVVAVGGSYGGMLSAYLQRQHPALISASWVSSAPLLGYADTLVQNDNREREIYNIISNAFPSPCAEDLGAAFRLLLEQPIGEIQDQLHICPSVIEDEIMTTPLSSATNPIIVNAVGWLQGQFGLLSNFNYPYSIDFAGHLLPAHPSIVACDHYYNAVAANKNNSSAAASIMTGAQQLMAALEWFVYPDGMDQAPCLELNNFYSYYLGLIPGPWTYQRCYDLIMAYEVGGANPMFLPCDEFAPNCWSQDAFDDFCREKFGKQPRPSKSRSHYFGVDAQSFLQQKAVITNGMLDPWGYGGIGYPGKDDFSPENSIWIEGASHHLDIWWPNPEDPPSIVEARSQTYRLIEKWLNQEEEEVRVTQSQPWSDNARVIPTSAAQLHTLSTGTAFSFCVQQLCLVLLYFSNWY